TFSKPPLFVITVNFFQKLNTGPLRYFVITRPVLNRLKVDEMLQNTDIRPSCHRPIGIISDKNVLAVNAFFSENSSLLVIVLE
ncbi:19778_t:CDS:2, partial [Dentiscutata erythropus]